MKYLPLVWAGIWRKRSRAVLMLLQIVSAFTLFGLLQGLNSGIKVAISKTHGDRLYVGSSVSLGDPLPISMLERLRSVSGVKYVTPRAQFPGSYQKPEQNVAVIGADVNTYFEVYNEFTFEPAQAVAALKGARQGAIAGKDTATRYGWKVGDRITLQSPQPKQDGSREWVFDLQGIYDVPGQAASANGLVINYDYLNEARLGGKDTANLYVALIDSPAHAGPISLAIDNAFANSTHETHTESEGDLIASQIQRIADLDYIVHGIVGAVFFALLLATGALMMQSIRERTPELAVLKTLGFSDRLVMALILAEAITFCVFSAGIGLGIAALILPLARSQIGITGMPIIVAVAGISIAILLALIGGSFPAWRGLRLQVAEALADR